MQIFAKVKEIVVGELFVEENEVIESASLIDDLGADSLDMVELTMAFEDAFDIEINGDEMQACKTVRDAVSLVERKLPANTKH